jgi:hypothetical protein
LEKQGHASWPGFDAEVLGGNYTGHHGAGPQTQLAAANEAADHPILRGVPLDELLGNGSLYRTSPLAESAKPLLIGSIEGHPSEPVAWTNLAGDKQARVFYTSLGHEEDFANPVFRKLLVNALFWALDDPYPRGQEIDKLLPQAEK